ncbi:MAG TPA: NAD-dependent epimerase/dehydratase family protein [Solirubrobacteraceae bacterium]|nr:NAD-dependent epimerase/dehydratase family protein [Solirubrobacteraceae bacterium]
MQSAFVTGAYGLLGTAIVRRLLQERVEVTVLRRDAAPRSALVLEGLESRVNVVSGDVTDGTAVERALAEYAPDTVFHLAAQSILGIAQRSPLTTWESNVRGTWTVVEACRDHGVARTVVAASHKAYGAHDQLPYREDFELRAQYPYDVSKAAADLIARSYWHTYGLPVATTRFTNVYGGGDLNRSRLVPEAIDAALAGRPPVIRSDGTPERDFLYVDDAIEAYLAIARALDGEGARGEAFNAGGGRPHAVREVVELICAIAGTDVEPDIRGTAAPGGEVDRQFVDTRKLGALTGWAPAVGLEEGLRRTVQWYRDHPLALAR